MRTFAKPLAARQVEARSRAKGKGVRVAVISEARSDVSISQSRPGITGYDNHRNENVRYALDVTTNGESCSSAAALSPQARA